MRITRFAIPVMLAVACGDNTGPARPPAPPPPPPPPTQVAYVVEPGQTMRDSALGSVTVEVRGASGSRIVGATNTVTLALGANPGSAVLTGVTSVAAVNGTATFTNLRLNAQGRGYTLVASSGALTPDTSVAFNIVIPMNPDGVTPGMGHSCAVLGYGVWCWGRNDNGELGDGTRTRRTLPVEVPFDWPFGAAVSQVTLGENHTCVTTSVAEVYCWGSNAEGQLGIGSEGGEHITPTLVSAPTTLSFLASGRAHTCALGWLGDSSWVYCWGANDVGQLGDGTNGRRTSPVPVADVSLGAMTAGANHTCAIAGAGHVAYCWGDNTFGQLGDSSTTARNAPVRVAGGHDFHHISARGNHTCGVTWSQELYCWGENSDGQLGDATTTHRTAPVQVVGGVPLFEVTAGGKFTCGMSSDVKLYCWGRNLDGQLGTGNFASQLTPHLVGGNLYPMGIIAGYGHACAKTWDTGTYCWGANGFGQLGDGTTNTRSTPGLLVY